MGIYIYTLHTCIIHTYHAWRGAQKIHRTHWANQTIPTDRIHRLGVAWSRVHVTRGTSGRWRKMPTRSPWRFIAGKIIYKWDKWPICWSCKLAKISGSCSIDVGFFGFHWSGDIDYMTRPGKRSHITNWKDPPCDFNGKIHELSTGPWLQTIAMFDITRG